MVGQSQWVCCFLCKDVVHKKFFCDHIAAHIDYDPFICLFNNCYSSFTSDRMLKFHSESKHGGMKKIKFVPNQRKDKLLKKLFEICSNEDVFMQEKIDKVLFSVLLKKNCHSTEFMNPNLNRLIVDDSDKPAAFSSLMLSTTVDAMEMLDKSMLIEDNLKSIALKTEAIPFKIVKTECINDGHSTESVHPNINRVIADVSAEQSSLSSLPLPAAALDVMEIQEKFMFIENDLKKKTLKSKDVPLQSVKTECVNDKDRLLETNLFIKCPLIDNQNDVIADTPSSATNNNNSIVDPSSSVAPVQNCVSSNNSNSTEIDREKLIIKIRLINPNNKTQNPLPLGARVDHMFSRPVALPPRYGPFFRPWSDKVVHPEIPSVSNIAKPLCDPGVQFQQMLKSEMTAPCNYYEFGEKFVSEKGNYGNQMAETSDQAYHVGETKPLFDPVVRFQRMLKSQMIAPCNYDELGERFVLETNSFGNQLADAFNQANHIGQTIDDVIRLTMSSPVDMMQNMSSTNGRHFSLSKKPDSKNYNVVKPDKTACKLLHISHAKAKYGMTSCHICFKRLANSKEVLHRHAISHLSQNSKLNWIYECCHCLPGQRRTSFRDTMITRHLRDKHNIKPSRRNIDYIDRSKDFSDKIAAMYHECFPVIQIVDGPKPADGLNNFVKDSGTDELWNSPVDIKNILPIINLPPLNNSQDVGKMIFSKENADLDNLIHSIKTELPDY